MHGNSGVRRLSGMGLLVAVGIVFGDIGTSPLYVMKAIVGACLITMPLTSLALCRV